MIEKMFVGASTMLTAALIAVQGLRAVMELVMYANQWAGAVKAAAAWSN